MKGARFHIGRSFANTKYVLGIILLFYLANLIFSWIPGRLLKTYMNDQIGNSVEVDRYTHQFDFTMMSDFIMQYGSGLSVIISLTILLVIIYILVYTFLVAGLSDHIVQGYHSLHRNDFLVGSSKYFFRILRLEILFLIIYAILFGIANFSFFKQGLNPFELESDAVLIDRFLIWNGLALIVGFMFRLWHETAKYFIVDTSRLWITRSLLNALKFVKKHLLSLVLVQLLFSIVSLGLLFLSVTLLSKLPMATITSQWVYIILCQLVIIFIIYLKIMKYFTIGGMYNTHGASSIEQS